MATRLTLIAAFGETSTHVRELANSVSLSTVLLIYDTILTLSCEVEYIWKRKLRLGKILYLVARYSPVLLFVLDMPLQFMKLPVPVCYIFQSFCDAILRGIYLVNVVSVRFYSKARPHVVPGHVMLSFTFHMLRTSCFSLGPKVKTSLCRPTLYRINAPRSSASKNIRYSRSQKTSFIFSYSSWPLHCGADTSMFFTVFP